MKADVASQGLRFLVVEGQNDLRRAIVGMLKSLGVPTVHSVPTGEEARDVLIGQPVDFVLCDWKAADINGIQLLRFVRETPILQHVAFLLMSRKGQMEPADIAEANENEADGLLVKPLNQQEIEAKMQEILKRKAEMTEPNTSLARAAAFTDIGAFDEAETELQNAQQKKPDASRVWLKSGDLYQEMGKEEKAKASYTAATKVDDECAKAYDNLSLILEKEGKEKEAFELLQRAAQISPRNKDRQFRISKSLLEKGNEDEARIALHKALAGEESDAVRSAAAAEFFLSAGRADLAEAEYAFALEADPENVHYFNRLGIAFRRQKKFKEAVENYRKALVVSPSDPVIYYNMALAMAENGEVQQAIGALRRAMVIAPQFKEAEQLLRKLSGGGR
ncbi:MAG: tetratricopeptide repeat protein [Nitrospinota bacterium]